MSSSLSEEGVNTSNPDPVNMSEPKKGDMIQSEDPKVCE